MTKLIKYDFRSAIRQIGPVWAALLVMSLVMGLLGSRFDSNLITESQLTSYILGLIPSLVFVGLFVATVVITIMIVVTRFYRGILGEEGYLMHTLPVSTGKLIASKGVVSAVVMIASGIIATISIFIIVISGDIPNFGEILDSILEAVKNEPKWLVFMLEICLYSIVGIMYQIYTIYAAMAIGQLSGKHRVLLSLGAFIGLSTLISTVNTRLLAGFVNSDISEKITDFESVLNYGWIGIIGVLAEVVLLHAVTERILSKKLNLL